MSTLTAQEKFNQRKANLAKRKKIHLVLTKQDKSVYDFMCLKYEGIQQSMKKNSFIKSKRLKTYRKNHV